MTVIAPNGITSPPPSRLDRAIAFVSPRWAAHRLLWRHFENSYKGGLPNRTSEYWPPADGNRFGNSVDRSHVGTARDRAYQAYENNPVAWTLVEVETDNVIGDGLNYQPTTSSEAWNREAIERYYAWLDECSVRGADVETGMEFQRSAWAMSRVAGDGGWILVSRGNESRLQLVRAEEIATPDELYSDKNVYDGIRFDSWGKPLTFYIRSQDERGTRKFEPIPARDFVWMPHMTRPNQARPPSCFITIFDILNDLERYREGVALAAWMATVFGIVFKKSTPAQQFGQLPTITNSQGEQQRAITFENGMVKYIGVGEEVAQVQAQQPMQQTPEFIRTMYRMLGQPFKMPLEVIAMDMSTCNFASARIGLLPFYRQCRIKAARFGTRWSRTIRWWLSRERLRGVDDPKRWRTEFPEDYWSHDLLPNEWDYTDPVSEVQGDMLQVDAGFKSPQMVMNEHGRDAKLVAKQRREWKTLTEGLPQLFSTMTREAAPKPAAAPANGTEEPTNDDDNDE